MTRQINIRFGALCPQIAEQLCEQGLFLPPREVERFQCFADATVRLAVNGFLTDGEVDKARKRIVRSLCEAVIANKPKPAESAE